MDGFAVHERDALEVFGDLIGACEDAQIIAQLLGPEVDFAQGLRAHAQQLLGGFGLERALVFDVRNPHRRQRRQQCREDGEHQHLGADAREPGKPQKSQVAIPPCAATEFITRTLPQGSPSCDLAHIGSPPQTWGFPPGESNARSPEPAFLP